MDRSKMEENVRPTYESCERELDVVLPAEKVSKDIFYKDLENVQDVDAAMNIIVHLVNIRNEFNRLQTWVIDFYARSRFSRSLYVNQRMSEILGCFDNLSKRNITKNDTFQEKFSELVSMMWTIAECEPVDIPSHDKVTRKLESTLILVDTLEHSKFVTKLFKGKMTDYTLALLNMLYHRMKHLDRKTSIWLAIYLLRCSIRDVCVDKVEEDVFKGLKSEQRGDVLWHIWRLVYHLVKTKLKTCGAAELEHWDYSYELVKNACRLSECFYAKTSRDSRIVLLVRVLNIILSPEKLDMIVPNDSIHDIHTKAKELYKQYFTRTYPKKKHITQYSLVRRPIKKKTKEEIQDEEEEQEHAAKHSVGQPRIKSLDYLKVYTCFGVDHPES